MLKRNSTISIAFKLSTTAAALMLASILPSQAVSAKAQEPPRGKKVPIESSAQPAQSKAPAQDEKRQQTTGQTAQPQANKQPQPQQSPSFNTDDGLAEAPEAVGGAVTKPVKPLTVPQSPTSIQPKNLPVTFGMISGAQRYRNQAPRPANAEGSQTTSSKPPDVYKDQTPRSAARQASPKKPREKSTSFLSRVTEHIMPRGLYAGSSINATQTGLLNGLSSVLAMFGAALVGVGWLSGFKPEKAL